MASEEMLGASKRRHEPTQDPIPLAAGIFQRHSAPSPASFLRNNTGTGAGREGLSRARQRGNPGAGPGAAGARLPSDRVPHSNTAGPEPVRRRQRRSGAALGPDPRAPARGYPRAKSAPLAGSHGYEKGRFPHSEDPAGPHSATRQPRGKPDRGRSAALRPGPGSPRWGVIGDLTSCPPPP